MEEKLIAVVDDEEDILELVSHHLKREGFRVKEFQNGRDFLLYVESSLIPDLVILDIMLPATDGLDICRSLRSKSRTHSIPIIMLTAKASEADVVVGLELGADDYIVKPFSPRELIARIKSILRRANKETDRKTIRIGPLQINTEKFEVSVDGKRVELTTTEFKILEVLAEGQGRVFTRDQLLKKKRLWGDDKLVYDRTIDVHIKNIREKLGKAGSMIKTIRSIGYKLEEQ